jgi:hypothetical protein
MALIVACRFGPKKNDPGGGGKLSAKRALQNIAVRAQRPFTDSPSATIRTTMTRKI